MTEFDAESRLCELLSRDGAHVKRQLALGGKHVDVAVAWDGDWDAVEVKLRDWRRGARQAAVNATYFSRTFVALPTNPRRKLDIGYLMAIGVGVIEFDEDSWRCVVEARRREPGPLVRSSLASLFA